MYFRGRVGNWEKSRPMRGNRIFWVELLGKLLKKGHITFCPSPFPDRILEAEHLSCSHLATSVGDKSHMQRLAKQKARRSLVAPAAFTRLNHPSRTPREGTVARATVALSQPVRCDVTLSQVRC